MKDNNLRGLDHIEANLSYTTASHRDARVRIFPPSSGRKIESPKSERVEMPIYDCRPIAHELKLDIAGFELANIASDFHDYYDPDAVREKYYPVTAELLKKAVGATAVFVFDHNVRNQTRADRKEPGVSIPTDGAHNDYTLDSGPRRIREVLEENHAANLLDRRAAIINVWRPIRGPVQDHPIAICDARTTSIADFVETEIEHYQDNNLDEPKLTGQIYSFRHNPQHCWFYVSDMQPSEALLLKCFDTATDGRACFTGHTGFKNLASPPDAIPRESIEVRTVVIYPEARVS
ncbi:MAG: CmcJ/NvfI family oxidoreductase [Gammaproteobacteria bacterium]